MKYVEDATLQHFSNIVHDQEMGARKIIFDISAYTQKQVSNDKKFHSKMNDAFNKEFSEPSDPYYCPPTASSLPPSEKGEKATSSHNQRKGAKRKSFDENDEATASSSYSSSSSSSSSSKPKKIPHNTTKSHSQSQNSSASPPSLTSLSTNTTNLDLSSKKSRSLLVDFILLLNTTFPDYNFDHIKSDNIEKVRSNRQGQPPSAVPVAHVKHLMSEFVTTYLKDEQLNNVGLNVNNSVNINVQNALLDTIGSDMVRGLGEGDGGKEVHSARGHQILHTMWNAIDDAVDGLKECDFYSYVPNTTRDGECPFTESNPLWQFNYFIHNAKLNKMVYFYSICIKNNEVDPSQGEGEGEGEEMDDHSHMELSAHESSSNLFEDNIERRKQAFFLDANCESPSQFIED